MVIRRGRGAAFAAAAALTRATTAVLRAAGVISEEELVPYNALAEALKAKLKK